MTARDESERRPPGRPHGAEADELEARRAEAWRLRVDEGRTFTDIAMLLGVSPSTACSYIATILERKLPGDEEVVTYRQQLVAEARARASLAFERADDLYQKAEDQTLILEGPRGGVIVSTLAPQMYGRAAMWEQRAMHHLDRLARWSGVEALVAKEGGPDPEALEGSIAAEAERFLAVMAEVDRKRAAAQEAIGANGSDSVNGNGSHG